MDPGPLVNEQIEAGAEFLAEFAKYAPIQVAYWLKEPGRSKWHLYVASERFNDSNYTQAMSEAGRIADQMRHPHLDMFQVKIVWRDEPARRDAVDIATRFAARLPVRYGPRYFGGREIEGVYIYATPKAVPAG